VAALIGIGIRLAVDRDPLRYERVRIWTVGFRVAAAEFPLGCGPGAVMRMSQLPTNFPRDGEFARFARIPDLAESDFLAAAASLGLPGVALVAGLMGCVVVRLRNRGPAAWGVAAALGSPRPSIRKRWLGASCGSGRWHLARCCLATAADG